MSRNDGPDDGWQNALLSAARHRGIVFGEEDLTAIKNQRDDSPLAAWVEENLVNGEPLTAEELQIWNQIQKKPKIQPKSHATSSQTPTIPLTEPEIGAATASLCASRIQLETHLHILQNQQSILRRYLHQHVLENKSTTSVGTKGFEARLERKRKAELQALRFENEQLCSKIQGVLSSFRERLNQSLKILPATVNSTLRADDRALERLEHFNSTNPRQGSKRSPSPELESFNTASYEAELEELLTALKTTTVSGIKERLDRIYLQTLLEVEPDTSNAEQESKTENGPHDDAFPDIESAEQIQADLDSLYADIDAVAAMHVEAEFGHDLKRTLWDIKDKQCEIKLWKAKTTQTALDDLTTNLTSLAVQAETLYSQRVVLDTITRYAEKIDSQPSAAANSTLPSISSLSGHSKTHSRTQSRSQIPSTTHPVSSAAGSSQPSSQYQQPQNKPALEFLLRHLSLSPSLSSHPTTDSNPTQSLSTLLSRIQSSTTTNLSGLHSLQSRTAIASDEGSERYKAVEAVEELDEEIGRVRGLVEGLGRG